MRQIFYFIVLLVTSVMWLIDYMEDKKLKKEKLALDTEILIMQRYCPDVD